MNADMSKSKVKKNNKLKAHSPLSYLLLICIITGMLFLPSCDGVNQTGSPADKMESSSEDETTEIISLGIVQIVPDLLFDAFRKATIDELEKLGYVDGQNLKIDYHDAQGDINNVTSIVAKFINDKVDVIFCISTLACVATVNASDTIPIVFGMVTDPLGAKLATQLEQPGGNITGVTALRPFEDVLKMIKEITPETEKVGVISNPGEQNSQFEVRQLKLYAPQNNLEIVEVNASSVSEVATAAESLVGRVDTIYVGGDTVAKQGITSIIQVCERERIPLFGSEQVDIELGVVAVYNWFPEGVGKQAAAILARVMEGEDPGMINIVTPVDFKLSINKEAAEKMGVEFPQSILDRADFIYP